MVSSLGYLSVAVMVFEMERLLEAELEAELDSLMAH